MSVSLSLNPRNYPGVHFSEQGAARQRAHATRVMPKGFDGTLSPETEDICKKQPFAVKLFERLQRLFGKVVWVGGPE